MKNQIEIVKKIADGMIGIGGIPSNEEFYAEFDMRVRDALRIHNFINCVCPNEIKTGTVAIHCCNLCGKPDEDWWGKLSF